MLLQLFVLVCLVCFSLFNGWWIFASNGSSSIFHLKLKAIEEQLIKINSAIDRLANAEANLHFRLNEKESQSLGIGYGRNDGHSVTRILPRFDFVVLVMGTASKQDVLRMEQAVNTWLAPNASSSMTFTIVLAVCKDDPGLQCDPARGKGHCVKHRPELVVLACEHGYKTLVSKSIEGYKYISSHFDFDYVLKADVDTISNLPCIEKQVEQISREGKCSSFGLGFWHDPDDTKVFSDSDPMYGGKYGNSAYLRDTGLSRYLPYPTGWIILWSGNVARFLGMHGEKDMPSWERHWSIDDAAIGTFLIGLETCRVTFRCPMKTDIGINDYKPMHTVFSLGSSLTVGQHLSIQGFEGPLADHVRGVGDLLNDDAKDLGHCAAKCKLLPNCAGFEFSPAAEANSAVGNCQLTASVIRTGSPFLDYSLYVKTSKNI